MVALTRLGELVLPKITRYARFGSNVPLADRLPFLISDGLDIGRHSAEVLIEPRTTIRGPLGSSLLDRFIRRVADHVLVWRCPAIPAPGILSPVFWTSHRTQMHRKLRQCRQMPQRCACRKADSPPTVTINLGQIAAECYQVGDDFSILVGLIWINSVNSQRRVNF
jgi:hypothetical protein